MKVDYREYLWIVDGVEEREIYTRRSEARAEKARRKANGDTTTSMQRANLVLTNRTVVR